MARFYYSSFNLSQFDGGIDRLQKVYHVRFLDESGTLVAEFIGGAGTNILSSDLDLTGSFYKEGAETPIVFSFPYTLGSGGDGTITTFQKQVQ